MKHDLTTWDLSSDTATYLGQHPEQLSALAEAKALPPLPPGYVPEVIEVLFDDVPYLRSVGGALIFARDCLPDYQPGCVEYRLDDQLAFFQIGSEVVIDRLGGLALVQGRVA
ncbi:hypothetical protein [Leptolyngbya sp. KIOST-1]|uniref:hypothetical protein n=1 Tax=Leptolyngbya sp. KIOST-1 TaxID=1229172 RepID=UPI000AE16410|nr:hypothetical protein [Leptolyngbya sp. KIOST-1]